MTRPMKDSGIPWIGEVPEGWKNIRLKNAFTRRDGGAWGNEQQNNGQDRICIRVADFDFERQSISDGEKTKRSFTAAQIDRLSLINGDILIEKSGGGDKTPVGRSVLFQGDMECLYSNFIERLRLSNSYNSEYMAYYLKAMYESTYMQIFIKQTTGIQNLDIGSMLNDLVAMPILSKQTEIASEIKKRTQEIDRLIALQEEMIEELQAYKQSVITEAVTKGLNPDVPMKDSGVEWIDTIPSHWEVVKLKSLVTELSSGVSVNSSDNPANSDEIGVLKTSCVYGDIFNDKENKRVLDGEIYRVKCPAIKDTLIISRMNTAELVGSCGYVENDHDNLYLPDRLWRVALNHNIMAKLIWYYMRSVVYRATLSSLATGTSSSMKNISQSQFLNMKIFIMPKEEQQEIVATLDRILAQTESLIEIKQSKIDTLKEYKTSLIYECVTGKRDCSGEDSL